MRTRAEQDEALAFSRAAVWMAGQITLGAAPEPPTDLTDRVTYRLPPAFYDDHVARELPAGVELRRTRSHVYVALSAAERDELLDDARFYVTDGKYMDGAFGLTSSARATVKALSVERIGC